MFRTRFILGAASALVATHAAAQPYAPPDPPFQLVAPEDRLTAIGIFQNADPVVKLVLAGLLVAAVVAVAVWIVGALRLRQGRPATTSGAFTYLSALGGAGPLIGLFGAAYTLLNSAIGLSNVRPAPSLSVIAPGLAEALASIALGLLAAAIGVIAHRRLKGRLYALEAAPPAAGETTQPTARLVRAG